MKKIIMLVSLIMVILLCIACDESSEPGVLGTDPQILQITFKPKWNLAKDELQYIEVEVYDPQGINDIAAVTIQIKDETDQIVFEDSLYDDGAYFHPQDGDIMAGDGYFRNQFVPNQTDTVAGIHTITINAEDISGNLATPSTFEILFGYSYPIEISNIIMPDTLKSGTAAEYLYITAFHPKGIDGISDISLRLFEHDQSILLETTKMFNDGDFENNGDLVANDSIYSYKMDSTFAAGKSGLYDIQILGINDFEEEYDSLKIPIYLENKVGNISQTDVPDRIERPSASGEYNRQLVRAWVSDPQGPGDIDSVYFYSRKPNGELANDGFPFVLVDNGLPFNIDNLLAEAGDEEKDDGIYSFSILVFDDAALGKYIFSFYLRDRAGNLTSVKFDSIEVY